ncbi:MAG: hypothetical protein AB1762_11085 [Gemmatimonadota bacterium]
MTAGRLITLNVLIRVAAGASGQIFAFVLSERIGEGARAAFGALVVGMRAAGYFATELIAAPIAGRIADRRGYLRVLRWGTALGVVSMFIAAGAVCFGVCCWPPACCWRALLRARAPHA